MAPGLLIGLGRQGLFIVSVVFSQMKYELVHIDIYFIQNNSSLVKKMQLIITLGDSTLSAERSLTLFLIRFVKL